VGTSPRDLSLRTIFDLLIFTLFTDLTSVSCFGNTAIASLVLMANGLQSGVYPIQLQFPERQ